MAETVRPSDTALRSQLNSMLDQLRAESAATEANRKPVALDQSSVGRLSRMDSMQMQEMARAAERRREISIQRTEAALRRLDEGSFGFCVVCDEPIAWRRLEADLAVPTCVVCAGKAS